MDWEQIKDNIISIAFVLLFVVLFVLGIFTTDWQGTWFRLNDPQVQTNILLIILIFMVSKIKKV
jgi:hypothetical protein